MGILSSISGFAQRIVVLTETSIRAHPLSLIERSISLSQLIPGKRSRVMVQFILDSYQSGSSEVGQGLEQTVDQTAGCNYCAQLSPEPLQDTPRGSVTPVCENCFSPLEIICAINEVQNGGQAPSAGTWDPNYGWFPY